MTVLSRIQLLALELVRKMDPFTEEDLAHIRYCSVDTVDTEQASSEGTAARVLMVAVTISFGDWGYREHRRENEPNELDTQAVFTFALERGKNKKLTGKIRGGFFDRNDSLVCELPHIKGW